MVSWLDMARIVRGQTLSLKRKEFIEAAHVGGVSTENRGAPHRAERAGRGGGLRLAAGAEHDPV